MGNKIKNAPREKSARKDRCQHYWIIETPSGPVSKGVCKYCGAVKEFQNFWQGSSWERETSKVLELPVMTNISSDQFDDC